jgi:pterin-4a-carbinolamine dehydratase
MTALPSLPDGWKNVERPPSLFRRFDFESYEKTREFLDKLAALSEETGLYPDLGFGTKHVNVTVYGGNGESPSAAEVDFARRTSELSGA